MNDSNLMSVSNVSIEEKYTEQFNFFKTYVDPAMYVVIIVIGLAANGTLLIIFARDRHIRTTANVMILNLAICDILNICINAPLHYLFHYYKNELGDIVSCRIFTAARQLLRSVSAISLVALSIQRFYATFPTPHAKPFNKNCYVALFLIIVWVLPLGIALPPIFIWKYYGRMCSDYNNPYTVRVINVLLASFYCVVLPVFILGFNLLTARRLRLSAEHFPGEIGHKMKSRRERSADVVTSLAVLYIVSYIPYWTWVVVVYCYDVDRYSEAVLLTEYVSKYLLFADACFNPVALYIASNSFRSLFRRYMRCCEN